MKSLDCIQCVFFCNLHKKQTSWNLPLTLGFLTTIKKQKSWKDYHIFIEAVCCCSFLAECSILKYRICYRNRVRCKMCRRSSGIVKFWITFRLRQCEAEDHRSLSSVRELTCVCNLFLCISYSSWYSFSKLKFMFIYHDLVDILQKICSSYTFHNFTVFRITRVYKCLKNFFLQFAITADIKSWPPDNFFYTCPFHASILFPSKE